MTWCKTQVGAFFSVFLPLFFWCCAEPPPSCLLFFLSHSACLNGCAMGKEVARGAE